MEQESRLYKVIYQSVLTQIYSGVLRYGQVFPSQSELCQRYQVGITTIRKVIRMLEQEGVIIPPPENVLSSVSMKANKPISCH